MYPLEGGAEKKTSSPEKRRSRGPEDGLRVVYLGVEVTEDGEEAQRETVSQELRVLEE